MPSHRLAAVALLGFAIASGGAFAQTSVTAAPTVTPAPNCEKPGNPPSSSTGELGKSAAEMKRNKWSEGMKAYLDCLKRFVDAEQAAAALHGRAANAAVDEYNKAIKVFNDQIEAQKQQ